MKKLLILLTLISVLSLSMLACERVDEGDETPEDGEGSSVEGGENTEGGSSENEGEEGDENTEGGSSENEGEEGDENTEGGSSENEGEEGDENTESGETEGDETVEAPIGKEIGNRAQTFPLQMIFEDGKAQIKDYRGKVVVVNFWGTWCGPCKSELPDFNRLADEYSDEVVFFMVHSNYSKNNAKSYIENNLPDSKMVFVYDVPLSSTASDSPDMYFTLLGGTSYYPRTVVIDENGIITYYQNGTMSYDALKGKITEALQ